MQSTDVLRARFDEVAELVAGLLADADAEVLHRRLTPGSNSLAWLLWHLTRVQDDHVADVAGTEQVWTAQGFAARAHLPFDDAETGYGFSAAQVEQVRVDAEDLAAYHRAVHEGTTRYLRRLSDADLDRVVDTRWDPPVTLGVRLGSVIGDDLQHVGAAAFLRGVLSDPS